MFCPNCGTQNSETASTCTKCGFNLKGAAAPKFKGTMLMNQQPAAPPAGPAPGQPGMGVPPPPAALAGTMMGVPPAGMGASASAAPAAPPPPAGYGQPGGYGAPPGQPGGYAPPGGQPVNPLGGTMAIDQMPFGGGGGAPPGPPAPGGYGSPPQAGFPPPGGAPPGGGYGAPPGADPYGAPPGGGYGPPPGGAPPGGDPFGAPPGGGYGPPPGAAVDTAQQMGGAYGAPPAGANLAAPGQFGASMGGGGGGGGSPSGFKGQTRNPVMTLVISCVCCFYALYQMWTMLNELQQYTNDQEFKPFWMFIPFLNYYFLWVKVPEQVGKAKKMAGSRNPAPGNIIMYMFFILYQLPKDLNEVWDPNAQ